MKNIHVLVIYGLITIFSGFLITSNYIAGGIITIICLVGIILAFLQEKRLYQNYLRNEEGISFAIDYLRLVKMTKNRKKSYEVTKYHLKNLNVDKTYEDAISNSSNLSEIYLGNLGMTVRENLYSNRVIPFNLALKEGEKHLYQLKQTSAIILQKKELLYSSLILALFLLIRIIFGEELIMYSSLDFMIVFSFTCCLPIYLRNAFLFMISKGE